MAAPLLDLDERRGMDKQKALESALSQIERNFGKGSIMKLGQGAVLDIEAVSTGSIGLDIALGIGGLPKGRIIEVYGPESSGKTTLALHVVSEEQKAGGICAFVDAEHALDPQYAKKLGVNLDDLLISQPDAGEQALEITETLVRSGAVSVVVVDSVAALTPKSELEGDMGDAQVGSQASSVRLDIRRIGAIKDRDEVVGNTTRVKVVKNKVAPPFKQVEFDIMYGEGISKMGELVDLGVKAGVVDKSGSWFSYGDQRIGQGRENAQLKAAPSEVAFFRLTLCMDSTSGRS